MSLAPSACGCGNSRPCPIHDVSYAQRLAMQLLCGLHPEQRTRLFCWFCCACGEYLEPGHAFHDCPSKKKDTMSEADTMRAPECQRETPTQPPQESQEELSDFLKGSDAVLRPYRLHALRKAEEEVERLKKLLNPSTK